MSDQKVFELDKRISKLETYLSVAFFVAAVFGIGAGFGAWAIQSARNEISTLNTDITSLKASVSTLNTGVENALTELKNAAVQEKMLLEETAEKLGATLSMQVATEVETTASATLGRLGVPTGLIAYFNSSCPEGWLPVDEMAGRYVVAVIDAAQSGSIFGEALTDGEQRVAAPHSHGFNSTTILSKRAHPGPTAGWNNGLGTSFQGNSDVGFGPIPATTSAPDNTSSIVAPYIQLVSCQRTEV